MSVLKLKTTPNSFNSTDMKNNFSVQQNKIYCELGSDCLASFVGMDYWGDAD